GCWGGGGRGRAGGAGLCGRLGSSGKNFAGFMALVWLWPLAAFRLVGGVTAAVVRAWVTGASGVAGGAAIAGWGGGARFSGGRAVRARVRRNSRRMLPVRLMSFHSESTAVRPTRWNRVMPRLCLTWPKRVSTVAARRR